MIRAYYAQDGYTFVDREARAAVRMLISDPSLGRLWVAEDQDTIVGYVAVALGFSFEYRGREAFLDELLVVESHRAAASAARRWRSPRRIAAKPA